MAKVSKKFETKTVKIPLVAQYAYGGAGYAVLNVTGNVATLHISALRNLPPSSSGSVTILNIPAEYRPLARFEDDRFLPATNGVDKAIRYAIETDGRVTATFYSTIQAGNLNVRANFTYIFGGGG